MARAAAEPAPSCSLIESVLQHVPLGGEAISLITALLTMASAAPLLGSHSSDSLHRVFKLLSQRYPAELKSAVSALMAAKGGSVTDTLLALLGETLPNTLAEPLAAAGTALYLAVDDAVPTVRVMVRY